MQTEQTNTQQTKKKVVKKVKETEQQEPVLQQQQVEVQTTAPVVDVISTSPEQTTQDFDVNIVIEFLNTVSDKPSTIL